MLKDAVFGTMPLSDLGGAVLSVNSTGSNGLYTVDRMSKDRHLHGEDAMKQKIRDMLRTEYGLEPKEPTK